MFHDATSSGARLGGTPVSRFRPRAFPWLFCKTGFAASMPRRRYRAIGDGFCSVKVKLTKRLAVGAGLLGSAHSIARRFPVRVRRNCYTGGVKQSLVVAREGWMSPLTLARKDQHRRGRAFSEPSLFYVFCSFSIFLESAL